MVAADAIEERDRVQRLREGGPAAVLRLLLRAVVGQTAVTPRPNDQLAACPRALVMSMGLLTIGMAYTCCTTAGSPKPRATEHRRDEHSPCSTAYPGVHAANML